MSSVLFIALFLLLPALAYRILKAARVDPLGVSIPSIFYWYFLLIAYVGILPVYLGWHWYSDTFFELADTSLTYQVFFYSASVLILTVFGFFLASRLQGTRQAGTWAHPAPLRRQSLFPLIFLVMVCAGVTALYLHHFSGSALSVSLSGDIAAAQVLRSEMTNAFKGGGYYSAFYSSLLHFCIFVLFSHALLVRKFSIWVLTFSAFLLAFYCSINGGEKAPMLWLLLGCFFTYLHTSQGKMRLKGLLTFSLAIILSLGLLINLFIGVEGRTVADLMGWVFSRIFVGAIIPSFYYLKMFPLYHDFLWGTSLPNPHEILPWNNYRLTVEVSEFMKGGHINYETVGSAPTAFWAEIYANFGPLAPLIAAPLLGFVIYLLHIVIGRLRPNPIKTGLVIWTAIHFMKLAQSGISDYLLDTDLMLVFASATLLLIANRQIRIAPRSTLSPKHADS